MGLFAQRLTAAQCPTAGGRCNAFDGHFMAPPTATVLQVSALQKRPPGGRSGAARRRAEARLDSARGSGGEGRAT
jgi:hypothetical protein